jgi:heavy metal sensor kinase
MVRSIRWRLQLWYTAVLASVIGGFGGLIYWQARSARFEQINTRLLAGAAYLDAVLRGFPPGELDNPRGEPPERSPFERGLGRPPPEGPPSSRPPDRGPRPGPPRRSPERMLDDLDLSKSASADAAAGDDHPYFVVWRADKRVLKATDSATLVLWPELPPATGAVQFLDHHGERSVITLGPRHTTILVGKSIGRELAELNSVAWQLAVGGTAALGLGLMGGWWVAARALRPIAAITKTASTISATQLSERIDTLRIDRELFELARVLNETFARLEDEFGRQARFTADASHELRTPLAALFSQVELALSRPRSPEEYRDSFERCLHAASRMRGLVNGLLTLARADSGKLDLESKPLDLRHIAGEIVEQHHADATRSSINLQSELAESAVVVSGDAVFLSRVVENILANALRHTPRGGTVRVALNTDGDAAILRVSDTGSGIAPEDQPRIFERFFRADQARARASGGTGLGLAICKCVVEAHGGSIRFTSQPNVRTEFIVSLPLHRRN